MAEKEKNNWLEGILPQLKAGATIKVHQKIKEKNVKGEEKERIQIFEGIILAHQSGRQKNATITVRKVAAGGIGVEKIFPIYSPNISKIEFVRAAKVRRAKLNFLPSYKKKLKEKTKVS
ncbi:MAG: 50S ribosomal protein L19 [Candidatus Buchananbacteria bacterium]|nr:50S ribosomal protein L19 [Candidatus Buchananbacteria bacterium]